jgi:hypothetical protein
VFSRRKVAVRDSLFAVLVLLVAAPAASEVTIDWVTVGNPGNVCDPQPQGCFGSVPYTYRISRHEITNAQYAEFLNAVAAFADFNGLYHPGMADELLSGITRTDLPRNVPGVYSYNATPGREANPVNYVTLFDAFRFANWLHNGQPTGLQNDSTTEDGAYTIIGGEFPVDLVVRNTGARVVLTSEAEWYKAAYYNPGSGGYFAYPAGADAQTTCSAIGTTPNTANCDANGGGGGHAKSRQWIGFETGKGKRNESR